VVAAIVAFVPLDTLRVVIGGFLLGYTASRLVILLAEMGLLVAALWVAPGSD